MAQDFIQKAPVGTVIFNKENQLHYIKVKENGRTFWKIQRGSRLHSLFIKGVDYTKDDIGKPIYKDRELVGTTGDEIADYLQIKRHGKEEYSTKKNNYIIKDGKYFLPDGTEITDHKFKKGSTYHIDGLKTDIGKQLQIDLDDTEDHKSYLKKNELIIHRDELIKDLATLKKNNKPVLASKVQQQLDKVLYDLGENKNQKIVPWVPPSKRNTSSPGIELKSYSGEDPLLKILKPPAKPPTDKKELILPWELSATPQQKKTISMLNESQKAFEKGEYSHA